ncbi:hypothetical protein BKA67DRAFT_537825 [Truncatella angustata]|uniref:FAD-binding PCMH-type domain-containing protein n=1 Tax=Truncatella angustata TaxID=152316 RepID=A0A9P8ZVI1_9PEZI|nr:uncharacterized protein BKA67DRAFT_537825 [Truncatella angustata]KAH6651976.1 hypothetical protein BKA67DRAFT_537825 [Truncatella angustata]KAH8205699.1 hypothetical protein TruAng_000193 [Truncatella angustata]
MSEIIAGKEYHDVALVGSKLHSVQAHAPALLALLERYPEMHIYTKSHPHFVELSRVRADRTDMEALALVRPVCEAEVSAVVKYCVERGIGIAIRSGGGDIAERSRSHGGVVIDMRSMDSMVLAADRKSIRIGGGLNSGTLLRFLDANGLDTPCGWGHEVGYIAWACGGGYGVECGARGMGADQILSGRVVTASGDILDAQPDNENKDVYWALRGGGAGILGVVSELTVKVHPKPKALAGYVWFPYTEAEKVFGNMQKLYEENFPDNFAAEVFLIDPLNNGGIINHFFWWELKADENDLEDAKAYHKKITECGTVVMDTVKDKNGKYNITSPYEFLYSIKNPGAETRLAYYNKSLTVPSISAEFGAILARHPLPTPTSVVVLHNCHGAGTRFDSTAAFGNREQHILVGLAALCDWADEDAKAQIKSWPGAVYDELVAAGLNTGWKYVNFNIREKDDGKMYLGEKGVERMRKLKGRWDPDDVFALCTPDLGISAT